MSEINKNKGVMLVLSSPSGAGKSSICKALLNLDKNLFLSISTTTRQKRPNEISGKDYNFVTEEEFKKQLKKIILLNTLKYLVIFMGLINFSLIIKLMREKTCCLILIGKEPNNLEKK